MILGGAEPASEHAEQLSGADDRANREARRRRRVQRAHQIHNDVLADHHCDAIGDRDDRSGKQGALVNPLAQVVLGLRDCGTNLPERARAVPSDGWGCWCGQELTVNATVMTSTVAKSWTCSDDIEVVPEKRQRPPNSASARTPRSRHSGELCSTCG